MSSSRRQFLRETAASVLGTVTPILSVSNDFFGDDDNHQQVPQYASRSEVHPFSWSRVGTQMVPEGDWIIHHFGWTTVPNEPKQNLVEMLEATSYEFEIEGVSINSQSSYWSGICQTDTGLWSAGWDFPTPPRPPGEYEFSLTITFHSPITSQLDDGGSRQWAGTYEHHGKYIVREADHDETQMER